MLYSNPNMLLRIAQADAYALACEYCEFHPEEQDFIDLREFKRYIMHPCGLLPAGSYTDDTQMSIAVAEALLSEKTTGYLGRGTFEACFFNAFKRDPRYGYMRGFQKILEESNSASEMVSKLHGTSDKNGACMRAVPIGVISDPARVIEVATMQAKVTHDSWGGITSACAVALMSHFALYDHRDFSYMCVWLTEQLPELKMFGARWTGPVQSRGPNNVGLGMVTAWAAHTLLVECDSLRSIMRRIVDWGGDTDTVAAIAWGIASTRYTSEQLPEFFERDLELRTGSNYKAPFLRRLGERLMEAYK